MTTQVLRLRAFDNRSEPVADVQLQVRRSGWIATVTTDPGGRADVVDIPDGPGPVRVHSLSAGWTGEATVEVPRGDEVAIHLERTGSIAVRVVDASGGGVPAVRILASDDRGWILTDRGPTDADGRWTGTGFRPGPVLLGVASSSPRGTSRFPWADVTRMVEVEPGTTVEIEVGCPQPTAALVVRVRHPDGAPAKDTEVWLAHPDCRAWTGHRAEVAGEDGIVRFAALCVGAFRVQGSCSANAAGVEVAVSEGESTLDLVVPMRADLVVDVVDHQQRPVSGVTVWCQVIPTGEQCRQGTNDEGRAVLPAIALGPLFLSVTHHRVEREHLHEVHDGAVQRLQLARPSSVTIRGSVATELDGARVHVRLVSRGTGTRWGTVENGRFEVSFSAEPGPCTVALRIADKVPIERSFPALDVVDFGLLVLEDGVTLTGRVEDEGRWISRGSFAKVSLKTPTVVDDKRWLAVVEAPISPDGAFRIRGVPRASVEVRIAVGSPNPPTVWRRAVVVVQPDTDLDLGLIPLVEG